MKHLVILAVMAFWALPSQAFNRSIEQLDSAISMQGQGKKKMNACKKINFSEDQKEAYKQVREVFMENTKKLRQRLKNLRNRYRKVLRNTNASGKRADKIARNLIKQRSRMASARTDMFHTIVYDVANTDQRRPLLRCVRQMRRH